MAAMTRSGAVAIESLYQSAPLQEYTHSRRCGTPVNVIIPSRMAATGKLAAWLIAQAAMQFSTLCHPRSGISDTRKTWVLSFPSHKHNHSPSTYAPFIPLGGFSLPNEYCLARTALCSSHDPGSSRPKTDVSHSV